MNPPPTADVRPLSRTHHGQTFDDPYEWLRDPKDADVIGYLEAENAWTEQQTGHLADLRQSIYDDISVRTQQTDLSVPSYVRHASADPAAEADTVAYWYYVRTVEGQEYPIHCRARAGDPASPPDLNASIDGEEVLLDGNVEAAGQDFFSLGGFEVSEDGRLLAWSVDVRGDERFTLRVKDLVTGGPLADEIPDIGYGLTWAGGGHLFFTRNDDAWRSYQILRHRLGSAAADDVVVWEEPDERFGLGVGMSQDRRWLVLGAGSTLTSEYRLLPTADPEGEPRVVAPRREGLDYSVEPAGDRLLIVHNQSGPDFELAEAPLDSASSADWRPVLPHRPGVRIAGVNAFERYAVVSLRRNGLTAVHVLPRRPDGSLAAGVDIAFDEPLYTVHSAGWPEYVTDRIRISFTSLVTPGSVFDYVLDTGEPVLRKQTPVLDHPEHGPYHRDHYVQVREWATAEDGTRVPISIVHHKDVVLDGSAPALLYGYGSYEISMDPAFRITRLPLLDRGFVFAIAHVRGGGELGRAWYENGKLLAKRATFTDFVACARHLVERRYTSTDRLAAQGASAGGLLMGAVANLAPDAFRAIQADVPFVDALTTILRPDLPLTVGEWEEWGNPLADPEVYAYMRSYSPYENVTAQAYPAILATTSLNDTRVFFTEPAKWVAALRAATPSVQPADRPILLKTEMVAGHGGVSGRYQQWKQLAFEYAWIIDQVGAAVAQDRLDLERNEGAA